VLTPTLYTIIQSQSSQNSMLNMSLVKHSVTRLPHLKSLLYKLTFKLATFHISSQHIKP